MECAAIQECLTACKVLGTYQNTAGKAMLSRMVSMLIKLGRRNHEFREDTLFYGNYDCGNGNDHDNEFQPGAKEGLLGG
jgi:hypothetical protein